ncbi:PIN domain-containing protein [Streptomyces sp. NPDC001127]|uniref:PIN domain-containing protein n=1 Tax=Streptomyces sp. NPDC001127 TaxID=3154377 RepID=UPI00332371BF
MIILDSSVLRECGLESSSVELLRTIRTVLGHGMSMPWMVMEELAAYQARKYQGKHTAASQALEALRRATPWQTALALDPIHLDRVREHWREQWSTVADVITPSDTVMREALFREANILGPCRADRSEKGGAGDAATWLTAVDYTRQHEDEVVYFVSSNTQDFGDGTLESYPYPMAADLEGIGDRFIHLTSLDDVLRRFARSIEADHGVAQEVIRTPEASTIVLGAAQEIMGAQGRFAGFERLSLRTEWGETRGRVRLLGGPTVVLDTVRDVVAYQVGFHEWYSVTARWLLRADVFDTGLGIISGASTWETRLLFHASPVGVAPKITLLRSWDPQPASVKDFERLSGNPAPPRV